MPSDLERAITRTRRAIAAESADVQARMVALYADVIEGLERELAKLAAIPLSEMTYTQLLTDARYRQLLAQTEALFDRFATDAQRTLLDAQRRAAGLGQDAAVPLMRSAMPEGMVVPIARLPDLALQQLLGALEASSPLTALLGRYGASASAAIQSAFVRGMATGKNPRAIAQAIRAQVGGEAWKAERLARTETLRAYRGALLQTYARNGHVLDGWRWSAAKSTRTCLACLALDGTIFPLTVQFMGAHPSCRCAPTPYIKGGPADAIPTGEDWFLSQPTAVRQKLLPKGAWEPFEDGTLSLGDFVQQDHSPVWGTTYREASLTAALSRASGPGRRAA